MTEKEIEDRRLWLRGITAPDDWVNTLCDLAIDGLQHRAVRQCQNERKANGGWCRVSGGCLTPEIRSKHD